MLRRVEAQAARTPDALAVSAPDGQLSYGDLNRRANGLAAHLRGLGVGLGDLVGVYLERSAALVVGFLGIWKAGAAYVPLDPAEPAERLRYLVEDAGLRVVVTAAQEPGAAGRSALAAPRGSVGEGHAPAGMAGAARLVQLGPGGTGPGDEGEANLARGLRGEHLAYVIYTSGSSGRPKGVLIAHAGLANLVAWHQETYQVTPADRAGQVAGPAFDAATWEIWPYLAAGASIHIPDEETRVDPAKLLPWFAATGITLAFLPTPLAVAALDEVWPPGLALRALLTGGAALPHGPRTPLPAALFNHYGPTENTVVATSAPVAVQPEPGAAPPMAGPSPAPKCMCWISTCSRRRWVCMASSTSAERASPGVISTAPR